MFDIPEEFTESSLWRQTGMESNSFVLAGDGCLRYDRVSSLRQKSSCIVQTSEITSTSALASSQDQLVIADGMLFFTVLLVIRLFTANLPLVLLLLNRFFGPENRLASFRRVNELFPNIASRLKQSCLLRLLSVSSLVRGKDAIVMAREPALAPFSTSSPEED
jgi:hypothetical protein